MAAGLTLATAATRSPGRAIHATVQVAGGGVAARTSGDPELPASLAGIRTRVPMAGAPQGADPAGRPSCPPVADLSQADMPDRLTA